MKILIIGGTGETGQWFVKFFKKKGFDVTVWGANKRHDIAHLLDVPFAEDLQGEIASSDIVLISVPINVTEDTIRDTAPHMKQGGLLMDITSVKTGPLAAMKKYVPAGVEILGTHPMFGPSIRDLKGQTVIIVPVEGRSDRWLPVMVDLYSKSGAHIEIMTAEEHDRMMAVVQGLTHFAYISIGAAFRELEFDVAKSRRFMSPLYEMLVDFVGRILGQNPYLYAMIQMNPAVLKVHDSFIGQCIRLSELVKQKDIENFVLEMKKSAAHFGDTEAALRRSDKMINSKISEHEELARSIGKERGLRHMYSGAVHAGIIRKITPRTVVIEEGKGTMELKIENIRLLTDREFYDWKVRNLKHSYRDISAKIPPCADPYIINRLIGKTEGIVSSEIIDTYRPDDGILSVTFRLAILGDEDAKSVQAEVENTLRGIGCTIR